ncbi:protein RGF1 INDUCIBLE TRANSCRIPTION FACTOR 1-like [Rutidosis leptorrhynchoides]|uniref:protein RGF1 INDUCIBLE TRANSCRIPTION FACTOR 1-like n=1 Tax=Rutidosis leptorrhynchoides TaxID=125765 RepID=UPI003A9A3D6B
MSPSQVAGDIWWLNYFLAQSFFLACGVHMHKQCNNSLNQYCIDCQTAACQHCLSEGTHSDHRVITIYRHVRKDVVALDQMSRHIDTLRIQPYMSNGRLTLALHPLPHTRSAQIEPNICCRTCTRKLISPKHYHYCSIACKFQMENGKKKTNKPTVKPTPPDNGADGNGENGAGKNYKRPRGPSRRKGVPMRSPLF